MRYWCLGDGATRYSIPVTRSLNRRAAEGVIATGHDRIDYKAGLEPLATHRYAVCSPFVCLHVSASLVVTAVRHKQPRQITIAVSESGEMPCSSLPFFYLLFYLFSFSSCNFVQDAILPPLQDY